MTDKRLKITIILSDYNVTFPIFSHLVDLLSVRYGGVTYQYHNLSGTWSDEAVESKELYNLDSIRHEPAHKIEIVTDDLNESDNLNFITNQFIKHRELINKTNVDWVHVEMSYIKAAHFSLRNLA